MSMKKKALMGASYVLVAAMAVGGTVAFLTDRDNATNTFTMGNVDIELNEDFEQGAELLPGVKIDKKVTIENTGKSDAYVWYTYAVPTALKELTDGDNQVKAILHCNLPGRFWNGYHTLDKYTNGNDPVDVSDTWIVDNVNYSEQVINGVEYNVYTVKYTGAIVPGEVTNIGLETVYLDANVDIHPNGDLYYVKNGNAEPVDWNINENGAPKIYVNAYGIQAEGFENVDEAYAAYMNQWNAEGETGMNGIYEDVTVTDVASVEELQNELNKGGTVMMNEDAELTTFLNMDKAVTTNLNLNDNNITRETGTGIYVDNADAELNIYGTGTVTATGGTVYCKNGVVNIYDGSYVSGGTKSDCIYAQGNGEINIYGGTFSSEHDSVSGLGFVLNLYDSDRATAKINVYGGTFVNFDPSNNAAEGAGTNFVADGYKVVSEAQDNGDVWYTVVKAD